MCLLAIPAPHHLAGVDLFSLSWTALRTTVAELPDEDFTRPSGCTGRLVRDLVCHLITDAGRRRLRRRSRRRTRRHGPAGQHPRRGPHRGRLPLRVRPGVDAAPPRPARAPPGHGGPPAQGLAARRKVPPLRLPHLVDRRSVDLTRHAPQLPCTACVVLSPVIDSRYATGSRGTATGSGSGWRETHV
ncbi:maleylpyruvate isomerase N-terminal domain-containing protein [Streptomyces sp. NPDC059340]|uniref:maleylpyruvate isomerase N-terminal domain-containing protein n=1 Tax=Streptomyces sp. NPDC059340 TaxID=3346806 RepID=UPI00368D410B